MKPVRHLFMTTLLGAACSISFAAGNDNLWETNITIKSELQSTTMPPMKSCMPKNNPIPNYKNCKVTSSGSSSGKFTAVTECPGPPPYTIKIDGTSTSNTMQGTMTVISSGTTMVQEFTGKVIGTCDVATYVDKPPMGSMPSGGMSMPSFDPSSLPPKRQNPGAAAPATPTAETPAAPAQDSPNAMDAAKKALGGFLRF